jgi:hemerythrin
MIAFQWESKYLIGHAVIDAEHQCLFQLANDVFTLSMPPVNQQAVAHTVQALFHYMEAHFRHEEELMSSVGFEGYPEQILAHQTIIRKVTETLTQAHLLSDFTAQLRHVIVDWVCEHILCEDMKIGQWIKQHPQQNASG